MGAKAHRAIVAAVSLVAVWACYAPEVPDRPPATTATRESRATTPPPASIPPSVWSVSILTTGGFSGGGKGAVSISSKSRCLPAEDAVAFAKPANWKPAYRREVESGRTDQFYYSMTFVADGVTHRTGWQDDSIDLLPDDLQKLYAAAWSCR